MKPLLVCGSGRTLFSDIMALGVDSDDKLNRFDIMAINDAIFAFPNAQHFVSYHTEKIEAWLTLRHCEVHDSKAIPIIHDIQTHSQFAHLYVKNVQKFEVQGGTSALFGVQVALAWGYNRVTLCGVPMDGEGRFFDPPWRRGHDYRATDGWQSWLRLYEAGRLKRVRSMSGFTRDLLGPPPPAWYAFEPQEPPALDEHARRFAHKLMGE